MHTLHDYGAGEALSALTSAACTFRARFLLALAQLFGTSLRRARALAPLGRGRWADCLALHHGRTSTSRGGVRGDLGREHRLRRGMLDQAGRIAVVVVDDRIHAVVEERRMAEVARRKPAKRGARHPPTSRAVDELIEHLVVGRLLVGVKGHRLSPRSREALGSFGLIEEGQPTPEAGRAVCIRRLVAPEVEDRHVTWPV